MDLYRKAVSRFLEWISDEKLENELVDYLLENQWERLREGEIKYKDYKEKKEEIKKDIRIVKREIVSAFAERGRRYLYILAPFLLVIPFAWVISSKLMQLLGILLSLLGSCILGLGLIKGIYWTYGIMIAAGHGSPSRYFQKSLLNDTVDGFFGVLFLIIGFILQLISLLS